MKTIFRKSLALCAALLVMGQWRHGIAQVFHRHRLGRAMTPKLSSLTLHAIQHQDENTQGMNAMKSISAIATTTTLAICALSFLSTFGLGQTALVAACARFYKDRDNHGASFSVCNTNSDTVPRGFNDQIFSINIPRGRKCILYTDARFKGRSIQIPWSRLSEIGSTKHGLFSKAGFFGSDRSYIFRGGDIRSTG